MFIIHKQGSHSATHHVDNGHEAIGFDGERFRNGIGVNGHSGGFGLSDSHVATIVIKLDALLFLGGDIAPDSLVSSQEFEITGTVGDVVTFRLETPVEIDGTQNIWLTFYNDGSIQYPAPAVADVGNPNSRWLGIDGYGWMDVASVSSEVYSWLAWVYVDGYDWIGESNESIAVYPNPTTGNLNISALGINHITVLNTLGQVVYDSHADGNMTTLDMSHYQAGIYMVRVTTENGESVKLVFKQ